MAAASEVLQDLADGRGKYAQAKLKSLEKVAVELATHAEMLAERLEAGDKLYQERDKELLKKSGELGTQEEELQAQKNLVVTNLAVQKKVLQEKEAELSTAERTLRIAERKLREAIKKKETNVQRCATIGAIVSGLVALPVGATPVAVACGAAVGGTFGAAIGAIQNSLSKKVEDGLSIRDHCRSNVNNAKSTIRSTENKISSFEPKMKSLTSDIERLNQQLKDLHRKRSELKIAIPILKESIEFWKLFSNLSKIGENKATSLQNIVAIANKEQFHSFKIFRSPGTQIKKSTFFEAWADIEKEAAKSGSHIFVFDYSCALCEKKYHDLPYLRGSDLICSTCQEELINPMCKLLFNILSNILSIMLKILRILFNQPGLSYFINVMFPRSMH